MTVLITDLSDPAQQRLFDALFALYERMFPEHERHSYETLVENMRRNADRKNARTVWLAATDDAGDALGGICAYIVPGSTDMPTLVTMAYMFVSQAARGKGLARRLEADLIAHAGPGRVLVVCDIEDPAKMAAAGITKAEYDESAALYNITPFERLVFWRDRMGYRGTDFPYVLLVGRPGAQPATVLSLHARMLENGRDVAVETLPAATLREAAAFINCQCPYAEIPDGYRHHPALQAMWSWPESNAHARVSPHLAAEFDHLKDHWK